MMNETKHVKVPASKRVVLAAVIDLVIVITFIAIGRRNHDEEMSLSGFTTALAPFVIALALSWLVGRIWLDPTSARSGVIVWVGTVTAGMMLRKFLFDDGTATAFVIVASVFVGALVNGWRTFARFRASS